jgi:hypothetical protein
MKMLIHVKFPHKEFNDYVKDGTIRQKLMKIMDELKPDPVYFTEHWGHRGAIMIVDVPSPSDVPKIAEPWFLIFNADVELRVAMTLDELQKADIETLGKQWT